LEKGKKKSGTNFEAMVLKKGDDVWPMCVGSFIVGVCVNGREGFQTSEWRICFIIVQFFARGKKKTIRDM
jgi:hypothetical protein